MNRNLKLSAFGTALASINLGIMAMYDGAGVVAQLGASDSQVFTAWYLLAFLGAFQLYALARAFSGGSWS